MFNTVRKHKEEITTTLKVDVTGKDTLRTQISSFPNLTLCLYYSTCFVLRNIHKILRRKTPLFTDS